MWKKTAPTDFQKHFELNIYGDQIVNVSTVAKEPVLAVVMTEEIVFFLDFLTLLSHRLRILQLVVSYIY